MSEFKAGNRAFLNKPGFHSDASIGYYLTVNERASVDGGISIRDCGDCIHLELDLHSEEWMENTIEKIDTMLRILREAKREAKKAQVVYKRVKRQRQKDKEEGSEYL